MTADGPATDDDIASCPKVLLHDHLDGGLRPDTLIELADDCGYAGLPSSDPAELAAWFRGAADSGSLERYLSTFTHTVAVMQTRDALERVAREAVVDLAADGVIHAEIRMAPELATAGGLGLDDAIQAMLDGLRAGEQQAAAQGRPVTTGLIVSAMRHLDRVGEVAEVARDRHGSGVVGFDLAGPEAGFPASRHAAALARLRAAGVPLTLHAGEGDGPASVRDALEQGATRLGHGVRVVEDPELLSEVVARGVCLEVAPTSNLQTGLAPTYAEHPFGELDRAGALVTVNTDNRLMSQTLPSTELGHLRDAFGLTRDDLLRYARTAAESAFLDDDARAGLLARLKQR
ncbi:MAG: adenosine deaminase [Actinomycetota bacterium]|nr:adenosine deaminase [Actinomycetota bacterium]